MSCFFRYKCSNEFLTANKTMTDAVKKCRRVQSQRFCVSQGFLSGQKSSKTVDMSIQLWGREGLDLQSEENALFLPWVKGRLFWENRGQHLPSHHNCPTLCQHLTDEGELTNHLTDHKALWVTDLVSCCVPLLQQLEPFQSIFAEYSFQKYKLEVPVRLCVETTAKRSLTALLPQSVAWGRAGRGANTKRQELISGQGRYQSSYCRMSTNPPFTTGLFPVLSLKNNN